MDNVVEQKSFQFAIRIVKLYKYLCSDKKEYTLSKQILRSGTSIGANIAEAQQAQSRPDFIAKLSIALKETAETKYWLRLLNATEYLCDAEYSSIFSDCVELEKLLVTIIRTTKQSYFSIFNFQLGGSPWASIPTFCSPLTTTAP